MSSIIHESQIVDVNFGKGVKLVKPINLYNCSLGEGVFVGPFVEIQKGVQVGERTKIQSHCFIL